MVSTKTTKINLNSPISVLEVGTVLDLFQECHFTLTAELDRQAETVQEK